MAFAVEDKRFEGVEFGEQIEAFMSVKAEVLWEKVKKHESGLRGDREFAFYAGMKIIERCGPETLLKFLERNELKDKDLAQRLEKEARSEIDRSRMG